MQRPSNPSSPVRLRPTSDSLSLVRNRAAQLADCERRRAQHPDQQTTQRYQRALETFEAACEAAYREAHLANSAVQQAIGEAASRPDRLGALMHIAETLSEQPSQAIRDLASAVRPYIQARPASAA
jgi:hypothetical protein